MDSNSDVVFLIAKRAILDASTKGEKGGNGGKGGGGRNRLPVRSSPFPIRIGPGSDAQARARQLRRLGRVFSEMVPFAEREVRGAYLETEAIYALRIQGVVFTTDDRAEKGRQKLLSISFPPSEDDGASLRELREMSGAFLRAAVVGSLMAFHKNVLAVDRVVCSNGVYILHHLRPPNSAILSDMLDQDRQGSAQAERHLFPFSQSLVQYFLGSTYLQGLDFQKDISTSFIDIINKL